MPLRRFLIGEISSKGSKYTNIQMYTNILTSQSLLRLPVIILLVIIVIDVIVVFVFLQLTVYVTIPAENWNVTSCDSQRKHNCWRNTDFRTDEIEYLSLGRGLSQFVMKGLFSSPSLVPLFSEIVVEQKVLKYFEGISFLATILNMHNNPGILQHCLIFTSYCVKANTWCASYDAETSYLQKDRENTERWFRFLKRWP